MKLDGSDKKREKNVKFKAKTACAISILHYYMDKGKYRYIINYEELYRINRKTNKKETIMKFKKNETGTEFSMDKGYILVHSFTKKYMNKYIVKTNGKGLTKIRKIKLE